MSRPRENPALGVARRHDLDGPWPAKPDLREGWLYGLQRAEQMAFIAGAAFERMLAQG